MQTVLAMDILAVPMACQVAATAAAFCLRDALASHHKLHAAVWMKWMGREQLKRCAGYKIETSNSIAVSARSFAV